MFGFVKQIFVSAILFFGCNISSVNSLNAGPLNAIPLKCVSVNNQERKIRPEIINFNSNEPLVYPHGIKVNNFKGRCCNINDLYSKLCVPYVVKSINVKVFNLM